MENPVSDDKLKDLIAAHTELQENREAELRAELAKMDAKINALHGKKTSLPGGAQTEAERASHEQKSAGKRVRTEEDDGNACISIGWPKIKNLYIPLMRLDKSAFPADQLDDRRFNAMLTALRVKENSHGSIYDGVDKATTELRRSDSIDIILSAVCNLFETEIPRVTRKAPLTSSAIFASGKADFMVTHERRKLLVVDAKKYDFDQGIAQDFLMMDIALAMSEADNLPADKSAVL